MSATARPFTARDLASLERVSTPALSPDRRHVAYVVRSTDWEKNRGSIALFILNLDGGAPLTVSSGERGAPNPVFSHDGRWLYFISSKSGSAQVWRYSIDGAARQQLTSFPVDVGGFGLQPDERGLILAADVYPTCPTLACTKERDEARAKVRGSAVEIKQGQPRGFDHYLDQKFWSLFAMDFAGGGAPADARPIMRGFRADVPADGDMRSVVLSRDGKLVYFVSADPLIDPGGQAFTRIYETPLDGAGRPRVLIEQSATSVFAPAMAPDGKSLAFLAVSAPVFTGGSAAVRLLDLTTGRTREIVRAAADAEYDQLAWASDGRALLATTQELGSRPLYRIEASSGVRAKIGGGSISYFDSAPGLVAFVREGGDSPPQLYLLDGVRERQLTHSSAIILAETELTSSEQFSFKGWNGDTVHGYVTKPYGFSENQRFPVAFLIHGGPQGSFGNAWSYRWNPQVWAGMGYAVVAIDFHGSTGYGSKFSNAIIGHWGDRPLEDLRKGWAAAQSRYSWLDGGRACAIGGSYGGYMINWMASQWNDPWKCFITHAGIFDLRSQAQAMDLGSFMDVQVGSAPVNSRRSNPADFASKWKKPILVIHGGTDFRVPTEQGISAYNAARRSGVTTELAIFPDENHWILKPENSVQWYALVQAWMDRWTGGPHVRPFIAREGKR